MQDQGEPADTEQRDVDDDGASMKSRELEWREVAGRRRLRTQPGRPRLRKQDTPRIHGSREHDPQEENGPPAKRGRPLPDRQHQDQHRRECRRHETESVVAWKEPFHETHGETPLDELERCRGDHEREEDLDPQAGAEERPRDDVRDAHHAAMMAMALDRCQGAGPARRHACGRDVTIRGRPAAPLDLTRSAGRTRRAAQASALVLSLVVAAPLGKSVFATADSVREARELFQRYDEDLGRIDRAREILERVVTQDPSVEALVLLAWVYLAWADLRATSPEEKLAGYERGRDVAKRAIELTPRSAEAHLWHAANLGRWAIHKGKLRAAFLLSTLREEIRIILELAPNHPAALSLAGSLDLETPGFLGGDLVRAEAYQRKALAADPHFTRARVELARCLIAQRRYGEARRELRQVLDETQPSYYADWAVRHRRAAERLLGEISEKS